MGPQAMYVNVGWSLILRRAVEQNDSPEFELKLRDPQCEEDTDSREQQTT